MNAPYAPRADWRGLALAVGLHVFALGVLLGLEPAAHTVGQPEPLMASLILPNPPEPQRPPEPLPHKVRPLPAAEPRPLAPPPLLSAPQAAPTPVTVAPPPEPAPLPAVQPPPAPAPEEPAAVAAPPAPTAPAPVIGPRFDADYLDNPAPAYPPLSRRLGEEGRVLLRVYVLADGSVGQVVVRESSGHERLDRAAADTVRRWRFVPARQADEPIPAWVLVPISFSLRR